MSESYLTHMIRVNMDNWEVRDARRRANSSPLPSPLRAPVEVGVREIERYVHGIEPPIDDAEAGYNHHV